MDGITISTYEYLKHFSDERAARNHLEHRRWNGSPACPHCGATARIQTRKREGYFRCLSCKVDFTIRTGTIFERSHVPLDKWLYAIYLIVTSRNGISSLQLSKEIGVTQKTAWFMLQRIREACGNGKNDDNDSNGFLRGIVEVDEVCFGGRESNKHESKKLKAGRGTVGKTAVISGTSASVIRAMVRKTVKVDSVLCMAEHSSYDGMPDYTHYVVNHSAKQFVDGLWMGWSTPTVSKACGPC